MSTERVRGVPTSPDHVCIRFCRSSVSLIEEPEVCENCEYWLDGSCVIDAQMEGDK